MTQCRRLTFLIKAESSAIELVHDAVADMAIAPVSAPDDANGHHVLVHDAESNILHRACIDHGFSGLIEAYNSDGTYEMVKCPFPERIVVVVVPDHSALTHIAVVRKDSAQRHELARFPVRSVDGT